MLHVFLISKTDLILIVENKMDAYNLAIVMAPVILQTNEMEGRRFSLMVHEMERNVRLVEKLIYFVSDIFETL